MLFICFWFIAFQILRVWYEKGTYIFCYIYLQGIFWKVPSDMEPFYDLRVRNLPLSPSSPHPIPPGELKDAQKSMIQMVKLCWSHHKKFLTVQKVYNWWGLRSHAYWFQRVNTVGNVLVLYMADLGLISSILGPKSFYPPHKKEVILAFTSLFI